MIFKSPIYRVLFFSFLSFNAYSQAKSDSIISWSKNNKLECVDFKGNVPKHTQWAAITTYLIYVEGTTTTGKLPKYSIEARFNRYLSWMRVDSNYVLVHEQLHFDIAELFARKMRQLLSELQLKGEKKMAIYNSSFTKLNQECYQMQRDYDKATTHGTNFPKQKEWSVSIAKKIKQLNKFE